MRQEQVAVKPTRLNPWEEVMIDCEGSSQPADVYGNTYVLTFLLPVSWGYPGADEVPERA